MVWGPSLCSKCVEALGGQRKVPLLMTLRGENGRGLDSTQRRLTHLEMHPLLTVSPSPSQHRGQGYDLEDSCSHRHKGAKVCPVGTVRDRVADIRKEMHWKVNTLEPGGWLPEADLWIPCLLSSPSPAP